MQYLLICKTTSYSSWFLAGDERKVFECVVGQSGKPPLLLFIRRGFQGSREHYKQTKEPFWCSALRCVSIEAFPTAGSWRQREEWCINTWEWLLWRKQGVQPWEKWQTMLYPSWLGNTQPAVTTSRSLLPVSADHRTHLLIRKEIKTPLYIQLLPYYFYHRASTEGYIKDFLATLTQNKTCSNTRALLLAHKLHKLGRKWEFRDTSMKAVKLRKQSLLLQEVIHQENTMQL